MEDVVDCSVLIPVLNEERYIGPAVAAMRRQRFAGTIEYVFADGGSRDRTREALAAFAAEDPRIRVVDNPSASVSSGLNVALAHARGRWVVRMDAHTVYPDDYVALGVARLQRGGTRWVSGPQVPVGHGPVSRAVSLALSAPLGRGASRKWRDGGGRSGPEYELDTGVFAGVWERTTLIEYGGWDERWPRNSDSEMAARFIEAGDTLICVPAMGAEYVPRDSVRKLFDQYLRYGEYRARTATAHPGSLRGSLLLPPAVVVTAAASVAPVGRGGGALRALRAARGLARLGMGGYAAALAAGAARSRAAAQAPGDAALVPVVLAAMHFGHGLGQLRGWARYGPPLAAMARLLGLSGLSRRLEPTPEPTYAPSLDEPPLASDPPDRPRLSAIAG
ncbi:MAG: glycosyltransferase [Solirubrobacterales bacterium]|nr:glycosyltransferase [Solirubrobacterales bacterium]